MKAKDTVKVFSKAIAIPAIIAASAVLTDCTMDEKKKQNNKVQNIEQLD